MRVAIEAVVAAACFVLSATASHARGPYGSITVGNWQGGAYTNDKNGAFTHCAAGTTYQSGIYFVVSIGENGSWRLGFAHESWRLTPGEAFPLALTFDGQPTFNVYGMPIGAQLVNVEMPTNSALITQFRKAKGDDGLCARPALSIQPESNRPVTPLAAQLRPQREEEGGVQCRRVRRRGGRLRRHRRMPRQQMRRRSKQSKSATQTGTGFVISSNGHVVTNQHVIDGCVARSRVI